MQDVHQLKETTRAIIDSQGLAVLATQGDKGPYGSLVAFAATADLKFLLFATTRATRKYANLVKNGGVALVIDTRTNRKADFADAAAVTALGVAEEIAGPERRELCRIYLEKHPSLREFTESPTTALLKVSVTTYVVVSRFQNVQELHVGE